MPDSFRLRVMKLVSAQLKTVPELADYVHEDGHPAERVFRGRDMFGVNDGLPCVVLLEDPRSEEPLNGTGNGSVAYNRLKLLIQGFVKDDKFHPLDPAYALSAEVIKAINAARTSRNRCFDSPRISDISIGQPVHRPGGDATSTQAYFLVPITLTIAEDLADPFA